MELSGKPHAPADLPGNTAPGTHWIGGWMGPGVGLDVMENRKISCPCWKRKPCLPAFRLAAIGTELSRLLPSVYALCERPSFTPIQTYRKKYDFEYCTPFICRWQLRRQQILNWMVASIPEFNLFWISSWVKVLFNSVVSEYLNVATFQNDIHLSLCYYSFLHSGDEASMLHSFLCVCFQTNLLTRVS
jgi:hypothetical protein